MNQSQANEYQNHKYSVFGGAPIDPARKYAAIVKTILLASFYAYIFPLGIYFSLFGLFLTYWVEKVK